MLRNLCQKSEPLAYTEVQTLSQPESEPLSYVLLIFCSEDLNYSRYSLQECQSLQLPST